MQGRQQIMRKFSLFQMYPPKFWFQNAKFTDYLELILVKKDDFNQLFELEQQLIRLDCLQKVVWNVAWFLTVIN